MIKILNESKKPSLWTIGFIDYENHSLRQISLNLLKFLGLNAVFDKDIYHQSVCVYQLDCPFFFVTTVKWDFSRRKKEHEIMFKKLTEGKKTPVGASNLNLRYLGQRIRLRTCPDWVQNSEKAHIWKVDLLRERTASARDVHVRRVDSQKHYVRHSTRESSHKWQLRVRRSRCKWEIYPGQEVNVTSFVQNNHPQFADFIIRQQKCETVRS